jgi:hypothetical protein
VLLKSSDSCLFEHSGTTHKLDIRKADLHRAGVYTVKAANLDGEDSASASLHVNGNVAKYSKQNTSVSLNEVSLFLLHTFQCETSANECAKGDQTSPSLFSDRGTGLFIHQSEVNLYNNTLNGSRQIYISGLKTAKIVTTLSCHDLRTSFLPAINVKFLLKIILFDNNII